ncbi:MAG: DnaA/Hda family protein [Rhodospirillales bacterium]
MAPANEEAVAWIDRWPEWPGAGLVIHGESGCGKSHLAQVFAAETRALVLSAESLAHPATRAAEEAPAYVVDDVDELVMTRDGAENLFHLYNNAKNGGKKVLLTGKAPPSRWAIPLADLRSRLNALDQVAIAPPDDALLGVLLVKQFADRQLRVEPDVVAYLTSRMERSAAAAVALVEALDLEALSRKQAITVPLARAVLDGLGGHQTTIPHV